MKICKLCPKPIGKDSPFSDYCSSECEKKAVSVHGMEKGTKKGLGFFATIIVIIAGTFFIGIKECTSGKKQTSKENQIVDIDSQNATNQTKEIQNISDDNINIDEAYSQIDEKEEELSNKSSDDSKSDQELSEQKDSLNKNNTANSKPIRMVEYEKHQDEIKKATEMLKQDKSIDEIAETTLLTRKEVRQLRRKLRNEE